MNWLLALPIRAKLWVTGIAIVALSFLALWTVWRIDRNRLAKAQGRAAALEAAREAERRIRTRQDALRLQQQRLREQIKARTERDAFEQGWGP